MAKRPIPTKSQALAGIEVVLANAEEHLTAADALAAASQPGLAVAHLVYAMEECEKARTLAKLVLGEPMTDDEVRSGLYDHKDRHIGALAKSWSSGAAMMDFLSEGLWEKLGRSPARTDEERWSQVIARHPEVLPPDWPETAGAVRERNLYVDLQRDGRWIGPAETVAADFERLRPAAVSLLRHHRAAYEREIRPLLRGSAS